MISQISFQILQKCHVILLKKNIKLKEKCYINKTHLATEKIFVLHHSLKINKQVGPNKLREEDWKKIKKLRSVYSTY